ncbi:hypothetical protein [Persephonella sp.]
MRLKFLAKIENRVFNFLDRDKFLNYIKTLKDGDYYLTISKVKKQRSLNQNNYYWGVVLKIISDYTGHTEEELHESLKIKFLPKKFDENGLLILGSTKKLSKAEFEEYLERIRVWASQVLELSIPLPNEFDCV